MTNLGATLQSLGHLREAAARHRQALALNPRYAEAHSNLAATLAALGQFDEAIEHAQAAISVKPNFMNPYVHGAFAEADRGRLDAAIEWLDRIPSNVGGSPLVLMARAEVLSRCVRFEEAVAVCNKAIALDATLGEAYLCLGKSLDALERTVEAIEAFDQAASLMPNPAESMARKGAALITLAREKDGLDCLECASRFDPFSATVQYIRAAALEFRVSQRDISRMEGLLAGEATPSPIDRMQIHFALGGSYLRNSAGADAFRHLNAGNRVKRSTLVYDVEKEERRMSAIADAFPAALFDGTSSWGDASELPVFVIGMPRSGTTLIEQILAAHPQIHGMGELRHFDSVARELAMRSTKTYPACVPLLAPTDFRALGRKYLQRLGTPPAGAARVVDKMPLNGLYAGLIALALPGARIICARRDPLDTCLSCYSMLFSTGQDFTYDMYELGRYHRGYSALTNHWRSVMPASSFIEVEYESVVEDLEGAARRLIEFVGLPWSSDCLRFFESTRPVGTASVLQVRRPLYASSVRRSRQFREELGPLIDALATAVPD